MMTRDEFQIFVKAHAKRFPEVEPFLRDDQHGQERARSWYAALKVLSPEAANAASLAILEGREPQPTWVSSHPAALLAHCGMRPPTSARDPVLAVNMEIARRSRELRAAGKTYDEICDELADLFARSEQLQQERTRKVLGR